MPNSIHNQKLSSSLLLICVVLTVLQFVGPCAALRQCLTNDYVQSMSPCLNSKRTIGYVKAPGAQCEGVAELTTVSANADCHCQLPDFTPVMSVCDNATQRQMVLRYATNTASSKCVASVRNPFPIGVHTPCVCQPSDIAATYTSCNSDGVRFTTGYWKRECPNVDNKKLSMPETQPTPCDLHCHPGEYLASPLTLCAPCPAGTYSVLGDHYQPPYVNHGGTPRLPSKFYTYCEARGTGQCSDWKVCSDGSCLYSGNNRGLDNLYTILTLTAHIVSYPATLEFTYRVSTEQHADYFLLFINNKRVFYISGESKKFERVTFNLLDSATSAILPCPWRLTQLSAPTSASAASIALRSYCLFHNQIRPYTQESFFSVKLAPHHITLVYVQDGCRADSFNMAQGKYALLKVPKLKRSSTATTKVTCTIQDQVQFAILHSVKGLLYYNEQQQQQHQQDSEAADDEHVTGAWPINNEGAPRIHIGSVRTPDALAIINGLKVGHNNVTVEFEPHAGRSIPIEFTYIKDRSLTRNDDRIEIRDIIVRGTKQHASDCIPCPAGTGSIAGTKTCLPCPAGTFADTPGVPYPCKMCPKHHTSTMGAASCIASPNCSIEDYVATHGPCLKDASNPEKFVRTLSYRLEKNPVCDINHTTYTPPPTVIVPCAVCPAGSFRNDTGHCERCMLGYALVPRDKRKTNTYLDACQPCLDGKTSHRVTTHNGFDSFNGTFPHTWRYTCTNCVGAGWKVGAVTNPLTHVPETVLSTGQGMMPGAVATLEHDSSRPFPGKISFTYFLSFDRDAPAEYADRVEAHFQVLEVDPFTGNLTNNPPIYTKKLGLSRSHATVSSFATHTLPAGPVVLRWTYEKVKATVRNVVLALQTLTIENDSNGGADSCIDCPVGYACPALLLGHSGKVIQCWPGTVGPKVNSFVCSQCARKGGYSATHGASQCTSCPRYNHPNSQGSACEVGRGCIFRLARGNGNGNAEQQQQQQQVQEEGSKKTTAAQEMMDNINEQGVKPRKAGTPLDADATAPAINLTYFATPRKIHIRSINQGEGGGGGSSQVTRDGADIQRTELELNLCSAQSPAMSCRTDPSLPVFACYTRCNSGSSESTESSDSACTNSLLADRAAFYPIFVEAGKMKYEVALRRSASAASTVSNDANNASLALVGVRAELEAEQCANDPTSKLLTNVTILCHVRTTSFEVVETRAINACTFNVTLRSRYGCPVCTNNSFVYSDSECHSGHRRRVYSYARSDGVPLDAATCFGGAPLPSSEFVKCPWATFEFGSTFNATWALLALVVLLIIMLVALIVHLYRSKRALYRNYAKLSMQAANAPTEMTEHGDQDGEHHHHHHGREVVHDDVGHLEEEHEHQ